MIVYVSGPITGIPNFQDAFAEVASKLRDGGYTVIDPCDAFGGQNGLPYETYMRFHIHSLLTADAIYMLPGWQQSRGARFEHQMAEMLNIHILGASA